MDSFQDWTQFFTRYKFIGTIFTFCFQTELHPKQHLSTVFFILYTLLEGLRYCYLYITSPPLEYALDYGGILCPLGIAGQCMILMKSFLMFESLILQLVLWFRPLSLLYFAGYEQRIQIPYYLNLSPENQALFLRNSRIIFKVGKWSMTLVIQSFWYVITFSCSVYFVFLNNFSLPSILLSCFWFMITIFDFEIFLFNTPMLYWFVLLAVHQLNLEIQQVFNFDASETRPQKVELHIFMYQRIVSRIQKFNSLASKLFACNAVVAVMFNGVMFHVIPLLYKRDSFVTAFFPHFTLIVATVFIVRSLFVFSATTLSASGNALKRRVHQILMQSNHLQPVKRRKLLNIIKSQICLTSIDGQIFDQRLFFRYIFYSLRSLLMFSKLFISKQEMQ